MSEGPAAALSTGWGDGESARLRRVGQALRLVFDTAALRPPASAFCGAAPHHPAVETTGRSRSRRPPLHDLSVSRRVTK